MQSIAALLRPPRFDDEQTNSRASVLHAILLTLLTIVVVYMVVAPLFLFSGNRSIYPISLAEIAIFLGMLGLLRWGYVTLTSWLLCGAIEALLLLAIYLSGGIQGIGYFSHISLVLIVGLLLGGRMALGAAGLSIVVGLAAWYIGDVELASQSIFHISTFSVWSEVSLNIISVAIFLRVWEGNSRNERERTSHELAERRRAEAALAKSEEQLRLALSASRVGTWNWDIASNEVVWSDEVGMLFGLSAGGLMGTFENYLDLLPPEDRPRIEAAIRHALTHQDQMAVEHRVIWPDGTVRWLAGRGETVQDGTGQPVRMAGTVLDISERVATEEALRASETRYRAIVESTDDLICRFLPDTTLTFVNEAYCRYFGRSREELLGQPFLRLVPESQRARIQDYLQELLENDQPVTYEHQVVTPSGELRWQQWTDRPIVDGDGKIRELQSVGRDTDARRKMEEHLQGSLHEKEVLLSEVHHRVKNNLQIVSSLLKLQAAHVGDGSAQAVLADSHSRINSMALIHERLYRAGDLAQIDFAAYVNDLVVHLFRSYDAASRGIVYTIDIPDLHLHVDSAIPCGLIINELVTNALKHAFPTQSSGRIAIAVQRDSGESDEGQSYRLTVRDDGIGLPPGLDIGQSESLGLQLIHTLAAQLDGSLAVLPGPGAGFCVTFSNG